MTLLARVAAHWQLRGASRPRLLHGGFANIVVRLETDGGAVVVRVAPAEVDAASVEWEHSLVRFLHEGVPEVVAPLAAPDGTTWISHNARIVSVLPFRPGVTPEAAAMRDAAAELLARLHLRGLEWPRAVEPRPRFPSLRDFDWEDNVVYRWDDVRRFLGRESEALRRELDELREWVLSVPSTTSAGPIHGDFFRRNLLVHGARIVAVFDWDNARPEWHAWELGRSAWELCHTGPDLDVDAARGFVRAYIAAGGPGRETEIVLPSIRSLRLLEPLWHYTRAARGLGWDADYTRENLTALARLRGVTFGL